MDEILDPEVRSFVHSLANSDTIDSDTDWVQAVATVIARKAPAEWTDDDLLALSARTPPAVRRASTDSWLSMPIDRADGGGPFDAYRVTVTRSDGIEQPLLVGIDQAAEARSRRQALDDALQKANPNHRIPPTGAPHAARATRRAAPARRGPKYRGS